QDPPRRLRRHGDRSAARADGPADGRRPPDPRRHLPADRGTQRIRPQGDRPLQVPPRTVGRTHRHAKPRAQARLPLGRGDRRVPPRRRQPGDHQVSIKTALAEEFGIQYPIFAFTPSKAVAAAVTRAGGMGVLGCVRYNDPAELDEVLDWMDANTDGKPYGVDVVMPNKVPTEGSSMDLGAMIPDEHKSFVNRVLDDLGVPPLG